MVMVVTTPLTVIIDGTGVGVHEDVDNSALVAEEEEEEEEEEDVVGSGRIGTIEVEVDEVLRVVGVVEVVGVEMDGTLAVVAG